MLTGGGGRFVSLMDSFFDISNVGDFESGMKQRKIFKHPYRHADDWRHVSIIDIGR